MADTAIPDLTALAGADVTDTDKLAIADVTAGTTKYITRPELIIALKKAGMTAMAFGEPADATVVAGNGVFWVDTSASPQTFNCKTRDTSSPEVVKNFVLG